MLIQQFLDQQVRLVRLALLEQQEAQDLLEQQVQMVRLDQLVRQEQQETLVQLVQRVQREQQERQVQMQLHCQISLCLAECSRISQYENCRIYNCFK